MTSQLSILVVCTANVCRSAYAAALMRSELRDFGVQVRSAGLSASPGQALCELAAERVSRSHALVLSHTSRQLQLDDLRASALVLTMTSAQRGEIGRLWWAGRDRTFTLIEAATIIRAAHSQHRLEDLAAVLSEHRSKVSMPVGSPRRFSWPSSGPTIQIDIPDGHTSRRRLDHRLTLDRVETTVAGLVASLKVILPRL